jgi:uncharacterized protein YoxC
MESLNWLFPVVLLILTLVMIVVGVYLVLVLMEARRTLRRLNHTLDIAEARLNAVVGPLQSLGGLANGMSTGLKVFETFVGWLQRDRK